MDQFAAIRGRSRQLRADAAIPDSLTALEAALCAARHEGLTVDLLDPDDPDLEGAHGLLDRTFRKIHVRNDLPVEEQAEVVAHEIGHFLIHDGPERGYFPRREQNGGDPNQRIETYGIKERREAQANCFAREFVLPRPLAKRLFLDAQAAPTIARNQRVRLDTVYQQVADGLLLPEVPERADDRAPSIRRSDPSQDRAVAHRDTPFLLRAGPGTGKTKTLTVRIVSLLEQGVPASQILALTFSNRAARELTERVQDAVGPSAANIWSGTFHAFGLDTIRRHHALFGVTADPRVVDTSEAVAMLEDALPSLEIVHHLNLMEPAVALRDILRGISRAKDELCTPEEYARLAEAMRREATSEDERVAAAKALEVALVYRHYQDRLTQERAVDYGDLIMRPTLLMRADLDFRDALRSKFTHVHVDEYQDVNRASAMLVREIVGDGENLWVVGDARQSIYRFRGASAANIARFEKDYPKGARDGLERNYRSTEEIVGTYTTFGATMKVSPYAGSAHLDSERGAGGPRPAIVVGDDQESEMDLLAGSIRELEGEGVPLSRQTVLARSNGMLANVAEALEARGLPVLYLGPLFDRPEVRDLLSILSIVAEDAGSALIRVAGLAGYNIPIDDAVTVIRRARDDQSRVIDLIAAPEGIEGLSAAGRSGMRLLHRDIGASNRGTTPWLALSRYLFDGGGYVRSLLTGDAAGDAMRRVAVRQLLDVLRLMPLAGSGTPIRRALDRIRHMILLADERDLRQLPGELDGLDGVRLLTVHASKGLEFEAVHLPGVYAGAVPAPNRAPACPPPRGMVEGEDSDAHEAEEECVLFVAMSRAMDHLRLYRCASRGGRTSNPSKFLERVPLVALGPRAPVRRLRAPAEYRAIPHPHPPAELTAGDIEDYVRCPRRFYYSRVLDLSARTRGGAYLEAHGCLQRVLAYVRSLGNGVAYDQAHASSIFEEAWSATDLPSHPFGAAYRRLTLSMLERLHTIAEGVGSGDGRLSTTVAGETVDVRVDRLEVDAGIRIVKTIRSGKPAKSHPDSLSATMMLMAVRDAFGAAARVENHYLLGGDPVPVTQTAKKLGNRLEECEAAVRRLRAGRYDPAVSDFNCPRCPHLFTCPAPSELEIG